MTVASLLAASSAVVRGQDRPWRVKTVLSPDGLAGQLTWDVDNRSRAQAGPYRRSPLRLKTRTFAPSRECADTAGRRKVSRPLLAPLNSAVRPSPPPMLLAKLAQTMSRAGGPTPSWQL